MSNLQMPNINPTTTDGSQIKNYLFQLVSELNFNFNDINKNLSDNEDIKNLAKQVNELSNDINNLYKLIKELKGE